MPELNTSQVLYFQKNDLNDTIYSVKQKYKDPILLEIYISERILHSILANRIPVSPSGLNAIIKKLNETKDPSIHIDKHSKFTFYSLEEAGKEYVKNILLPEIITNESHEEKVHNIIQLLIAFKDRNSKDWIDILKQIIEGKDHQDECEEALGFLKEITDFYKKNSDEALNLIRLTITDKELQNKMSLYLEDSKNMVYENLWNLLNLWIKDDYLEAYRLIDDIFEFISGRKDNLDPSEYELQDLEDNLENLTDKIQACILQTIMRGLSKKDIIVSLQEYSIENHMAIYLAEKIVVLIMEEGLRNNEIIKNCI